MSIRRVLDPKLGPARCPDCGGRIVWALGDRNRRVPIDAQTLIAGAASGGWVLWFDDDGDGEQRASEVHAYEARTGETYRGHLWGSHYASCPERTHHQAGDDRQLPIWGVINGGRR
jgi:hypothetical protein